MDQESSSKYMKIALLDEITKKEIGLALSENHPKDISDENESSEEWLDYKLANQASSASSYIEIPNEVKNALLINGEKKAVDYLKNFGISEEDGKVIYHAFGNVDHEILGKIYQAFKKEYGNAIEIAQSLDLFNNDFKKVLEAIETNFDKDKKETLYQTSLKIKNKNKISLEEDPTLFNPNYNISEIRHPGRPTVKEVSSIEEMTTGYVTEDGFNFMKYAFRDVRDNDKRVDPSQNDNFDLEKQLRDAGMHIIN